MASMYDCKVIKHSVSPSGVELATLQLTYPRFIHEQVLTHRVFSRNSSSSRAMPVNKVVTQCKTDPVKPIHWGKNQPGMQAYEQVDLPAQERAEYIWQQACNQAIYATEALQTLGIHKQVANRLLHPFQYIQVVITSTTWHNFLNLRRHPTAQPEIKQLGELVYTALKNSTPEKLNIGQWHLPYITEADMHLPIQVLVKISAARCARVSYFLHDGRKPDIDADIALFEKLAGAAPRHLSPLEHVAVALTNTQQVANFTGWCQLRYFWDADNVGYEPVVWLNNPAVFSLPQIELVPLPDKKTYVCLSEFSYYRRKSGKAVTVPFGFSSDLASIPPWLDKLFPKTGPYAVAGLIHDYLYFSGQTEYDREESDYIFLEVMQENKVQPVVSYPFYAATRLYGGYWWDKAREVS